MNPAYLTGIQKREEDNGDITYYRTPNFDLLRQPGNPVGAELRANAQSLLDMPGNSAVSLWNNTLQVDKTKEVIWDYDEILTDKQKEDFVEAYVDYGLGANYFTQEIIEREEKAPKPKELTVTERKAAEKAGKNKVSLEVIDKIKLPTIQRVGPAEEGRQLLDMNALEKALAPYFFNVKEALDVGGTGGFRLTKNVDGADRTVTIFETSSEKEIKDALKFIETGLQEYAPKKPSLPGLSTN